MNDALRVALKQLPLSGLLESRGVRLQEAAGNSLSHAEFLELVLQDELVVPADRQLQRRVKAAQFRELKSLDEFDWSFNLSIKKKQIFDLASGRFIREARDVLLLGPPRAHEDGAFVDLDAEALDAAEAPAWAAEEIVESLRVDIAAQRPGGETEGKAQTHLLRCIVGNPFRIATLNSPSASRTGRGRPCGSALAGPWW
jgi:IstB-like ATP binding protein